MSNFTKVCKAFMTSKALQGLSFVALGISVSGTIGFYICRRKTIYDVKSESIFKDTAAILEGYEHAVKELGPPLTYPNTNEYIDGRKTGMYNYGKNAQICVPVAGSRNKAQLFSYGSRQEVDTRWQVDKVDIMMNRDRWTFYIHPSKQHLLIPFQDMKDEDYANEVSQVMVDAIKLNKQQSPDIDNVITSHDNIKECDLETNVKHGQKTLDVDSTGNAMPSSSTANNKVSLRDSFKLQKSIT